MGSAFAAGGTLNSRRAASPLVRLVEGKREGVLPLNWGETVLNRSVPCMVLKTTANDLNTKISCAHVNPMGSEKFNPPRN
ncbi:hypothetical protein TNCV_5028921 [Trichonephila clavipes]|nr:hypothetical protein TNCV_5028921 [Trichonephila clavipes]